ncbi:hypothetical protein C0Q70_09797 [Pomacea canaliculata]|uniref:RING-type domain-containing protein n=1 Tax=Pomacea canaliculata TaxID=400727 RepID=A0A2T7PAT2_POMCA|nr:hypothetical protein C0Q70_09797 [Pomacea canaliculata]
MMAEFHNSGAVGDIAPVVVRKVDSTTNAAMDSEDGSVPKSSDLDRFLQQQRSDLMYELRRIRFGDRPVTGQNNRENIEKFISKHMQEPAGASHGKDNVPANVDAVDVHRPEAVVVEVQGVFEQRRVSSILQHLTSGATWKTLFGISYFQLSKELQDHYNGHLVMQQQTGNKKHGTAFLRIIYITLVATEKQWPDFVRSIPQSQNHIHNDFSQFGIMPGLVDDNADNISITGISATAVPYTQTNMHMSREIQSLKSQMEEMKNMLRLSFDLQMDIQRAIRQEVAAALSAFTGQGDAAASVETQASRSVPVNDAYCLICMDSYSDCVLYQCGHMCVCFLCGKSLLTRGNAKCPVCRAAIRDVIRAYKTNAE